MLEFLFSTNLSLICIPTVVLGVEVVDSDIAVVEAADDHVGVGGVEVHAHDAAGRGADPLRVGGVLQREQADVTPSWRDSFIIIIIVIISIIITIIITIMFIITWLLVEVVGAEADGEEVWILRGPAERGDLQVLGLGQREPPQRQQASLNVLKLITGVLPEPEVLRDLIEGVEIDHPLQDLGGLQHPLPLALLLPLGRSHRRHSRGSDDLLHLVLLLLLPPGLVPEGIMMELLMEYRCI